MADKTDPKADPNNPNWKADKPVAAPPPAEPKLEPAKVLAVKAAWWRPNVDDEFVSRYPIADLKVGDGFFVANADVLPAVAMDVLSKEISRANKYWGVPEYDETGSEVFQDVTVKGSKPDGTLTASIVHRRRMLYARYYGCVAVTKDQEIGDGVKAPADGVLVVRQA